MHLHAASCAATDAKKKTFELPGVLSSLEAADWAQHLCGGLNAPYLLSRVALLPQASKQGRGGEWVWETISK
jgi:hypothetical protein